MITPQRPRQDASALTRALWIWGRHIHWKCTGYIELLDGGLPADVHSPYGPRTPVIPHPSPEFQMVDPQVRIIYEIGDEKMRRAMLVLEHKFSCVSEVRIGISRDRYARLLKLGRQLVAARLGYRC